jgi:tetratricopeptide (TPR) repeat protein
MHPQDYAQDLCLMAAALLQQAEATGEGSWMEDAIECYQQAMAYDPERIEPYLALGYLSLLHQQPETARPFLLKAQAIDPFDPQLHGLWDTLESVAQEIAP